MTQDDKPSDMDTVYAPFTEDQVDSLNWYQRTSSFHEFTCGNDNCPGKRHVSYNPKYKPPEPAPTGDMLVATANGWICPSCDYTQNWAHLYMANWAWEEEVEGER